MVVAPEELDPGPEEHVGPVGAEERREPTEENVMVVERGHGEHSWFVVGSLCPKKWAQTGSEMGSEMGSDGLNLPGNIRN